MTGGCFCSVVIVYFITFFCFEHIWYRLVFLFKVSDAEEVASKIKVFVYSFINLIFSFLFFELVYVFIYNDCCFYVEVYYGVV